VRELDAFEQQIVEAVEKYGWFALSVAPRTDSDGPEEWFTYTIGLPKSRRWPELICFGLGAETARDILADAIAECDAKKITPAAGLILTDTLNGFDALLTDGSQIPDDYFGTATWFARYASTKAPPDRLQLMWPDKAGRFPTDPDCNQAVRESQIPLE
jgi:hypothetical protein